MLRLEGRATALPMVERYVDHRDEPDRSVSGDAMLDGKGSGVSTQ